MKTIDIEQFWQNHSRFLKDNLVTETPNPKTHNLSQLCQSNLTEAFSLFKQTELDAITKLKQYLPHIEKLQKSIVLALANKNRVFIIGCGASGRLAVLLKRQWQHEHPDLDQQIISVCAAGDVSLIKSVEQFEDHAEFGIRQLIQQGYSSDDLLIGLSASGESPFILSAIEYASIHSKYKPFLLFNNRSQSLLERNPQHIIVSSKVYALELDVGPMALTGSTRLQATTAMQIALGIAMDSSNLKLDEKLDKIITQIKEFPLEKLSAITALETQYAANKEYILYKTNDIFLGLSILADTTERSPTFNLPVYENENDVGSSYSQSYLSLIGINSSTKAWEFLLGTKPLCLSWRSFPATSRSYINGFDFSAKSTRAKGSYLPKAQYTANWLIDNNTLSISLGDESLSLTLPDDLLTRCIIYKLCLNSHSTLMMGRLGYFRSNMMLSLKPSNFKLIDRAIRYSKFILEYEHKVLIEYDRLATIVFDEINKLEPNQSIVDNVVAASLHMIQRNNEKI